MRRWRVRTGWRLPLAPQPRRTNSTAGFLHTGLVSTWKTYAPFDAYLRDIPLRFIVSGLAKFVGGAFSVIAFSAG